MKRKSRKLFGKYLIVCEGETEKNYFNFLKSKLPDNYRRNIIIEIKNTKGGDALNVVEKAKKLKKELEINEVWVVFDYDNFNNIEKAFLEANKASLKVAFSNICFELWFLLHFNYSTSQFSNCKKLIENLKKNIKDYEKSKTIYFNLFLSKLPEAIKNAKKLEKFNQENNKIHQKNPYTSIYKLILEVFDKLEILTNNNPL